MDEAEKMARGQWYDARALQKERDLAEVLNVELNTCAPERRKACLEKIMQRPLKKGTTVGIPVWFDYGPNVKIGRDTEIGRNCTFMDGAGITIGNHVYVGPNCGFYTARHPLDVKTRNEGLEQALPITIEDDVWLGAGVMVLPGITIGQGAVVGAGSVVVRDVPANAMAAGNPADIKRMLVQNLSEEERAQEVEEPVLMASIRLFKQEDRDLEFEVSLSHQVDGNKEGTGLALLEEIKGAQDRIAGKIRAHMEKWGTIPFKRMETADPSNPDNIVMSLLIFQDAGLEMSAAIFYSPEVTNGYAEDEVLLDEEIGPEVDEIQDVVERYLRAGVTFS